MLARESRLEVLSHHRGTTIASGFTLGVIELDRILRDAIQPGTLLVISGHPGSGKTTLASTICYVNALQGKKCLYISFQESKEKLYVNMARLGLNLEEIERRGVVEPLKTTTGC